MSVTNHVSSIVPSFLIHAYISSYAILTGAFLRFGRAKQLKLRPSWQIIILHVMDIFTTVAGPAHFTPKVQVKSWALRT